MIANKNRLLYTLAILSLLVSFFAPQGNSLVSAAPANNSQAASHITVSDIKAGGFHTCLLTSQGGVWCWGLNYYGQIGDGTTTERNVPVQVSGLASGVNVITVGYRHTCALTNNGGVKCWGDNRQQQVSPSAPPVIQTPITVDGLTTGVVALAAGWEHTCALMIAGTVTCWGKSSYTQVPANLTGVTKIAAGAEHTCALKNDSSVICWGSDSYGQLGNGVSGATAITTGRYHTCVLTNSGGITCWGANTAGQLNNGVGKITNGMVAVEAGGDQTCALTSSGGIKCWGNNVMSQLGTDPLSNPKQPNDVIGLTSGITALTVGLYHTCAVINTGKAKCWGANFYGQVGDGTGGSRLTPTEVTGLASGVSQIALGDSHVCALSTTGSVKCWGGSFFTSVATTEQRFQIPTDITGLPSGITAIAAGYENTCALANTGVVKCWVIGAPNLAFTVEGLTKTISSLTVSVSSICILTMSGSVQCRPLFFPEGATEDIPDLTSGVVSIESGYSHACAVTNLGEVKCWQLASPMPTPTLVANLSNATTISVGDDRACAVTAAGAMKCWMLDTLVAEDVNGLTSGVVAITEGMIHTCALLTTGGAKCWGDNLFGQIGDGTRTDRPTPTDVIGLSNGTFSILTGTLHTCALDTNGGVKCWGSNFTGELGNGTAWRATATDVLLRFYSAYFPIVQR